MSVFIGSTTPAQRKCLDKEFHKLYSKKKAFMPRKQKIAIALNTCDVGIKGLKNSDLKSLEEKFVKTFVDKKNYVASERKVSLAFGKLYRHLTEVDKMSPMDAANHIARLTINL